MRRVNSPQRPLAACFSAATLLTAEVLAALTLWRLGGVGGLGIETHELRHWLRTADAEDLLGATARLVALILVSWLIATTLASMARRAIPALRGASSLDALTLPVVRRFLDRALVLSIGVSTLVGQNASGATTGAGRTDPSRAPTVTTTALPAGGTHFTVTPEGDFLIRATADSGPSGDEPADAPPFHREPTSEAPLSGNAGPDTGAQETLVIRAPDGTDPPQGDRRTGAAASSTAVSTTGTTAPRSSSDTTVTRGAPQHGAPPTTGAAGRTGRADGAASTPGAPTRQRNAAHARITHYEVQPGDSLWRIAEQRVAIVLPGDSADSVSRYWALLIESNRATLRSGDPSLIYPGEVVVLPALGGSLP